MTAALPIPLTLEEFLKLPETQPPSEFINGKVNQKSMPQGKHSRLQLKFCETVNQVTERAQVALAFPELRCTFGERSIIPDATVFTWDRIPFDSNEEVSNTFEIYPDWTVEILSPDQKATKVISNILHCLRFGTKLGWLIDPDERLILAFIPGQEPIELIERDRVPVPEFLTLELTVAQVFGWLKVGR
ncbi:Uma2 family endonuclease [Lusitaniella coriacea LEGE 07157]|uniref:Uma2 family endonuclease n=1 Tax=Lusitaniella coriacea LEGE 07157 TaxID=945747 RepID=A0A8J7DZW7_9CYAN|nr:Uma2 family endonuclease [Lusitaniella coriacea]MBE9116819.1 Uma2 family endonuclease [Lusitaniella coriacea LEGE 07157]